MKFYGLFPDPQNPGKFLVDLTNQKRSNTCLSRCTSPLLNWLVFIFGPASGCAIVSAI